MFDELYSIRKHLEKEKNKAKRAAASLVNKQRAGRFAPYAQVVKGVYNEWNEMHEHLETLGTGRHPSKKTVAKFGKWLLIALITLSPPVRKQMYADLRIDAVTWSKAAGRFRIQVPWDFKTSVSSSITHVELSQLLTKPMARWLQHRHMLNIISGVDAARNNVLLFVNQRGTSIADSVLASFKSFGFKHVRIASLGVHIMRDVFVTWFSQAHPDADRTLFAAVATTMATSVDMLLKHYMHLLGEACATRIANMLDELQAARPAPAAGHRRPAPAAGQMALGNNALFAPEPDDADVLFYDDNANDIETPVFADTPAATTSLPKPPETLVCDASSREAIEVWAQRSIAFALARCPRSGRYDMLPGRVVKSFATGGSRKSKGRKGTGRKAAAASAQAAAAPSLKRKRAEDDDEVRLAQSVAQFCRRRWGETKERQDQPVLIMDITSYGMLHGDPNRKKPYSIAEITKIMEELQLDDRVHFTSSKVMNVYIAVTRKIKELKQTVEHAGCSVEELHALVASVTCMAEYKELPDARNRASLYGSMRTSAGVPLYRQLGLASVRRLYAKLAFKK